MSPLTRAGNAVVSTALLLGVLLVPLSFTHAVVKDKAKPRGEIRDDKALVYFVRSPDWGRGVESLLYVFSDEQFLGALLKNSYTFVHLDPGVHYLWHSAAVREKAHADLASTRELELKAGTETFVVMNYRVPPHVFFAVVEEEQGLALLKRARVHTAPEESDMNEANAMSRKRLAWLEEMKERSDSPDAVVRTVPDEERLKLLCDAQEVFIEETKIEETGKGGRLSEADEFEKAIHKRLRQSRYESVQEREQADLVLTSTVDKKRIETRGGGFKFIRTVQVALLTPDNREVWSVELDNADVTTANIFNTWGQLARRVVTKMGDDCKQPKK